MPITTDEAIRIARELSDNDIPFTSILQDGTINHPAPLTSEQQAVANAIVNPAPEDRREAKIEQYIRENMVRIIKHIILALPNNIVRGYLLEVRTYITEQRNRERPAPPRWKGRR